jgi:hypothetical protein
MAARMAAKQNCLLARRRDRRKRYLENIRLMRTRCCTQH